MKAVRCAGAATAAALLLLWTACGETYRPVANPIIPPQPNPAFTHVVMVLSDNGANNPGASTTIDVSGDSATSQSQTGLEPVHAVLVGGTQVYVANSLEDTVSGFSAANAVPVITISLPSSCALPPCSMPVFLGTTETTELYAANFKSNTVSAISTISNVMTNNITVGTGPVALAETPDANKVYVANQGTQRQWRFGDRHQYPGQKRGCESSADEFRLGFAGVGAWPDPTAKGCTCWIREAAWWWPLIPLSIPWSAASRSAPAPISWFTTQP